MGEALKTEYQVVLTKVGDGASLAIADLRNLQTAAAATNSKLAQNGKTVAEVSNHYNTLKESTKATRESLRALHSTVEIMGLQTFPQATIGVMTLVQGIKAMRGVAIASGAGLGVVAVALAGVVAVVATATVAWSAYKAKQIEVTSEINSANQASNTRYALAKKIRDLEKEGSLSNETANMMAGSLMRAPANDVGPLARGITEMLAERGLMVTGEQEAAVKRLKELEHERMLETLDDYERERVAAYDKYAAEIKQLDALNAKATQKGGPEIAQSAYGAAREALDATERRLNEAKAEKERAAAEAAANAERVETARQTAEELRTFEQGLTITALQSSETKIQIARREHDERIALYDEMFMHFKMDEVEYTNLVNEASIKQIQAIKKTQTEIQKIGDYAKERFAEGFSQAFVDFVSGTKSASDAFREFAASFMQDLARMILKMEMLKLLEAIGFSGGGVAMAAHGGMFPQYAASGLAGVRSVSSPTYFPRFNVVAGEAGHEMLTVLAKPRFMEVGGIQAVVGNAGPNRLAITNADALARGGAGGGGSVTINVNLDAGMRASIIDDSVNGAVVRVTQDMGRHTALREATRKA